MGPDFDADPRDLEEAPGGARRRRRLMRAVLAVAVVAVVATLVAVAAGGLWVRSRLRASLPRLEGEVALDGLAAPVIVERDELGIPTIRGRDRIDVARATGYVHAQDRFFQMDLMRRSSAGELAALFGPAALESDRAMRVHRFRSIARRALLRHHEGFGAVLDAYTSGVNQGLADLESPPFEYAVLRVQPEPWRAEDVVLVLLSMYVRLQDERGRGESDLGVMRDVLPGPLFDFLATPGTEWDAPLVGEPVTTPAIPGPEVVDLRGAPPPARSAAARTTPRSAAAAGSNNWAVGGSLTGHGGALLANDMHLGLAVPNTWYRASFLWPRDGSGELHRVTGVTLPGAPAMVVGSNGAIAWGFTNSYGDWSDLVVLEADPDEPEVYRTPDGPARIEHHRETVEVRGAEDVVVDVAWTVWGPVIDEDHRGRRRALRWVAHEPAALNLRMMDLEWARGVAEAVRVAAGCGVPAQNFVVADSGGSIAWSILGTIPRRVGFDGRLPGSWADGSRRWDGWLEPREYPSIVDPVGARLWTANNRVVDGEMLRVVGDGGYVLGSRAGRIRDRLLELDAADEAAMLAVQLDDRALFLERWRDLVLSVLTPGVIAQDPRRGEFRRLVETDWTGRASVDSVGYRLVRAFRLFLSDDVYGSLTAPCREADPRFSPAAFQREGPIWKILSEKPPHLLDARFAGWDRRMVAAVDETLDYFETLEDGTPLAGRTWGDRNTTRIRHPLSGAVPWVGRWLDMPVEPLPGDGHMPRVQSPVEGASQRMVVAPGREEYGLFHMPCGQSGHPLSPHYRDAHAAWAGGRPTPFLPGPPRHTLTLLP